MTTFTFTRGGFYSRRREPPSNPRIININLSIRICQEQTDRSSQRTHHHPTHHYQAIATESIRPTQQWDMTSLPSEIKHTPFTPLINIPLPLIHIRGTIVGNKTSTHGLSKIATTIIRHRGSIDTIHICRATYPYSLPRIHIVGEPYDLVGWGT
jgi:hypothetical protein